MLQTYFILEIGDGNLYQNLGVLYNESFFIIPPTYYALNIPISLPEKDLAACKFVDSSSNDM